MTLDQAIKISTRQINSPEYTHYPEYREAIKLGIEALKRYKVIRANFGKLREDQLPGETKD